MRTPPRPALRLSAPPRHVLGPVALAAALAVIPAAAAAQARTALPEDGRLVAGQATVSRQDHHLTVTQKTPRAILEWHSFDIGADASVRFIQPSGSAVTLNRVVGGNPSRIAGQLSANGHVYLVNPAGVLFTPGARVDVGHLLSSRVDIGNRAFMDGDSHVDTNAGTRPGALLPPAQQGGTPPQLRVEEPGNGDDIATQAPQDKQAPAGLLTLAAGVGGHLRVGLEPEQVQALIDEGGLQEDGEDLVLSAEGSSALASSAVAVGEAPQARAAAVRNGRLLLVAAPAAAPPASTDMPQAGPSAL